MYVSLCGPHSLDTSTFVPTVRPELLADAEGPCWSRYWYLFHQLGPGVEFAARAALESDKAQKSKQAIFMGPSERARSISLPVSGERSGESWTCR